MDDEKYHLNLMLTPDIQRVMDEINYPGLLQISILIKML